MAATFLNNNTTTKKKRKENGQVKKWSWLGSWLDIDHNPSLSMTFFFFYLKTKRKKKGKKLFDDQLCGCLGFPSVWKKKKLEESQLLLRRQQLSFPPSTIY